MIRARRKRVQGMDERVTLTNVIIHSGQKTVSRYIRPVVMHHVAFTFSKTKNIMSTRCMYAFCLRVTRMREPTLVPFLPGTCSAKNYYLYFSFRRSLLLFYQFPRISQPPLLYNLISLTNKPSIQCITLFFG